MHVRVCGRRRYRGRGGPICAFRRVTSGGAVERDGSARCERSDIVFRSASFRRQPQEGFSSVPRFCCFVLVFFYEQSERISRRRGCNGIAEFRSMAVTEVPRRQCRGRVTAGQSGREAVGAAAAVGPCLPIILCALREERSLRNFEIEAWKRFGVKVNPNLRYVFVQYLKLSASAPSCSRHGCVSHVNAT